MGLKFRLDMLKWMNCSPLTRRNEDRMMVPFKYIDFSDVPRLIMVRYRGKLFVLGSYFDDALDDYEEHYTIEIVPPWVEQRIIESSWKVLEEIQRHPVGTFPVKEMIFDKTKRQFLDTGFLDKYVQSALDQ